MKENNMENFYKTKQVFLQIPANENYANVFADKYKVREVDDTIYLEEKQDKRSELEIANALIGTIQGAIDIMEELADQQQDFLTEEEKKYDEPTFKRNGVKLERDKKTK